MTDDAKPASPAEEATTELTKEESDAIESDFADPDNWLEIPDFGILPHDVKLAGFSYPICRGSLPPFENWRFRVVAENIRSMVATSRVALRKHFTSMVQVRSANRLWCDEYIVSLDDKVSPRRPTEREFAAISYSMMTLEFRKALGVDAASNLVGLAIGSEWLTSWLAGDMGRLLERAAPLLQREGRPRSEKTDFLIREIASNPLLGNRELADKILSDAPRDDGKSPFYWTGSAWFDRDMGRETDVAKLTASIQKARERYAKKDR